MKIDYPTPEQIPQLRKLWKEAFGDGEAFLDLYFDRVFSSDRCRCVTEDDTVAAALYWLDCRCEGRPMAYLYAVATEKKHRGRGLCRSLMLDTHRLLAELGYAGCLLVPGELSLFEMYGTMGYGPCCTIREFFAEAALDPAQLQELTPEEYAAARRAALPEGAVLQEGESLTFLAHLAKFYRGPDFLLCAAVHPGELVGLELLGNADAAPAILAALGRESGIFRTPGQGREFALFHPLSPVSAPKYFGFAFD